MMKKRFAAILLAGLMLFSLGISAFAEDATLTAVYQNERITVTGENLTGTLAAVAVRDASGKIFKTIPAVSKYVSYSNGTLTATLMDLGVIDKNAEYTVVLVDNMDAEIKTAVVTFEDDAATFTVTFTGDGVTERTINVVEGEKIGAQMPANPTRTGYTFTGWKTADGSEVNAETVPTGNMTAIAQWTKNAPDQFTVTFDTDGGSNVAPQTVNSGEKADKPNDPTKKGYEFAGWFLGDEEFDFNTPITEDITLVAHWTKEGSSVVAPVGPGGSKPGTTDPGTTDPGTTQPGAVTSIFTDVDGHWAVNNGAIQYVYDNKLMTGATATSFAPNATTTRAQIMVILARRAGVDTEGASVWYQKGLDWAVANGISDGTRPNDSITRQELAALLYRVIGAPEVTGDLAAYPDASAVSDWAVNGMLWATQNGIISGTETGALNPTGNATRAEVATILMRFCQQYPVQAPAAE